MDDGWDGIAAGWRSDVLMMITNCISFFSFVISLGVEGVERANTLMNVQPMAGRGRPFIETISTGTLY
jgi:hypothetical protein